MSVDTRLGLKGGSFEEDWVRDRIMLRPNRNFYKPTKPRAARGVVRSWLGNCLKDLNRGERS